MKIRQEPYDRLCDPIELMIAFDQTRATAIATIADRALIAEYEAHLEYNLRDLGARLAGRCYRPPASVRFDQRTVHDAPHSFKMRALEDLIAQQSARNALGEVFEAKFLDCGFGANSECGAGMAVSRILAYRAGGDIYAVVSGVDFGFSPLDDDLALRAIASRINDSRMTNLIGMWLDGGLLRHWQAADPGAAQSPKWMRELAPDFGDEIENELADRGDNYDRFRQAIIETARRFGRDAALVGAVSSLISMSSGRSPGEILKPKPLALAAAAVLAANLYPQAAQALRERLAAVGSGSTARSISPLAPMLVGVALHDFDLAMAGAGLRYVRHTADFAITTRNGQIARQIHAAAMRRLREMRLAPKQPPVPIKRFDQGVEFCGYRFHEHLIAATPIMTPGRTELDRAVLIEALHRSLDLLRRSAPLGARVKERVSNGVNKLGAMIGQRRR